jgi:hypothetical protein
MGPRRLLTALPALRRSPWRRPVIATAVVVLVLAAQAAGSEVYGSLRTPAAVDGQLARQGVAQIAVSLAFTPEQFNLEYLQGMGNIVRVHGDTVYMSGVAGSGVRSIAGQYWVSSVRPWNGN